MIFEFSNNILNSMYVFLFFDIAYFERTFVLLPNLTIWACKSRDAFLCTIFSSIHLDYNTIIPDKINGTYFITAFKAVPT